MALGRGVRFQAQRPRHANTLHLRSTLIFIVQGFVTSLNGDVPISGAPSKSLSDSAVGKSPSEGHVFEAEEMLRVVLLHVGR